METSTPPVAILIVDDHPENLLVMEAILADLGQKLVTATSGGDALRHMLRQEFAVILLDVQMPVMDGFETATLIRQREKSRLTPIIFVTAIHRGGGHVARGYSLGAVDYLFKPLDPEILRAKVSALVDLYSANQELHRQAEMLREFERREHARRMAEMEEMNRQIQEASRLKSEFVANMSHELRTPLNAIIGFAQLMHDADPALPPEKAHEFLGYILSGSLHLLALINDVLDLVKVESGRMEFFMEKVHLSSLLTEVLEIVEGLAIQKRIQIQSRIELEPEEVMADVARLRQVLYNYLSNALKFTPEGGRVEVRALAAGPEHFRIEVEDNGIGIRPEDLKRLFVEFEQLEAGSSKNYPGTGLGLALTRRIVEAQGGSVGVSSQPGQGSTFIATLPKMASKTTTTEFAGNGESGASATPAPQAGVEQPPGPEEPERTDLHWRPDDGAPVPDGARTHPHPESACGSFARVPSS